MRTLAMAAVCATAISVSGCETTQGNTGLGAAIGGAIGAVVGGVIDDGGAGGIAAGAAIGALIGGGIGYALDQQAIERQNEATVEAAENAEIGERQTWTSTSTDETTGEEVTTVGWVTPTTEEYVGTDGRGCRDVQRSVRQGDGDVQTETVTVCRTEVADAGATAWATP